MHPKNGFNFFTLRMLNWLNSSFTDARLVFFQCYVIQWEQSKKKSKKEQGLSERWQRKNGLAKKLNMYFHYGEQL